MKRDPQYPVTLLPDGTVVCDVRTRSLFLNPDPRGKRVAISSDGICHGFKKMPLERTRKSDGAIVGQVYLRGKQFKGVVREGRLEDGTPVSFIWAEVPVVIRDTVEVWLPCPLDRDIWNASGRPVGYPLEAFAFQAGIEDLELARAVQESLLTRRPLLGYPNVAVPVGVRPWSLPPGVTAFVAPLPLSDRAGYFECGLTGAEEWEDWRDILGWQGPGSALAAIELRDAVLRGCGVATEGLVDGIS